MAPRTPITVRELPEGHVVLPGGRLIVGRDEERGLVIWARRPGGLVRSIACSSLPTPRRDP